VASRDEQYTTGYATREGLQFGISIKHISDGKAAEQRGKILEVSTDGVKLPASKMIPIGDTISLNLDVAHLNIAFSSSAIVSWAGLRSDNQWSYGCALNEKLPERVIKRLACAGYIERRQAERHKIQMARMFTRTMKNSAARSVSKITRRAAFVLLPKSSSPNRTDCS